MNRIIFILIAIISLNSIAQTNSNWNQVNIPPISGYWYKLAFSDNYNGYAIAPTHLYSTSDGGANWNLKFQLNGNGNEQFLNIYYNNDSIIIYSHDFVTDTTKEYSKHNNDSAFVQTKFFNPNPIEQEAIIQRDSLWSIQNGSGLIVSKDGNRRIVKSGDFSGLVSVWKKQHMAASLRTHILYSNDSGKTWQQTLNGLPWNNFMHGASVFSLGQDTLLYHYSGFPWQEYITYNGGVSMINRLNGNSLNRPSIIKPFLNSKELIGARQNVVMFSSDLGFTFTAFDTLLQNIKEFYQLNDSTFFALCLNGVIYKSTNSGGLVAIHKHIKQEDNFEVFPNPVKNHLNLKTNWSIKNIQIRDQKGKIIIHNKNPKFRINVSDLKDGIYFLELNTTDCSKAIKFIKQ